MNIYQYSDRAKQAVQSAQSLALARRHQQLAPEHLLKVLLEEKDGLSRALIQAAGGGKDTAVWVFDPATGRVNCSEKVLSTGSVLPPTKGKRSVNSLGLWA